MRTNPLSLWFDMAMLGLEAQQVMALRLIKLAGGGARARSEAQRMVSEKTLAAQQAAWRGMTGASPGTIVRSYRSKVRANSRRLTRKKK